ncbi:MAG: hypothetical protein KGL39_33495 [Patescibacteria group bacterium]|nr:hypothetical protein [Patescibacteria group bacterium]
MAKNENKPDAGTGAGDDQPTLDQRLAALESRVARLESQPQSRLEAVKTQPDRQSVTDLLHSELKQLEKNPAPRVAAKVAGGLTREQAEQAVEKRKRFLRTELGVKAVALIALVFGLLFSARAADTQGYPQTFVPLSNLPAVLANLSVSNSFPDYITLRKGQGLAMQYQFDSAALATSNAVVLLYPSVDGTNYDTSPWVFARAAQTTNTVVATTNWSASTLSGYYSFKVVLTNANSASVTNLGLLFNRPN